MLLLSPPCFFFTPLPGTPFPLILGVGAQATHLSKLPGHLPPNRLDWTPPLVPAVQGFPRPLCLPHPSLATGLSPHWPTSSGSQLCRDSPPPHTSLLLSGFAETSFYTLSAPTHSWHLERSPCSSQAWGASPRAVRTPRPLSQASFHPQDDPM